jgi:hypothetical protein
MNDRLLSGFLKGKPTFLHYDDEIKLMKMMLGLPVAWIDQHRDEFKGALDALWESHTIGSGYLSQPEEDDAFWEHFCQWLIELNDQKKIPTLVFVPDLSPKTTGLNEFRKQRSTKTPGQ